MYIARDINIQTATDRRRHNREGKPWEDDKKVTI